MQKTKELPQVQYDERIVDDTVVMQRQVPTIQTLVKMIDVPQSHYLD